MQGTYLAAVLCCLTLVNQVSTHFNSQPPCKNCQLWSKVWHYGWWPVKSAHYTVANKLQLKQHQYKLFMKWALGKDWNKMINRYIQYKIWFKIQLNKFPFNKYICKAWVIWPKTGKPILVWKYSYCTPYKY